MWRGSQLSNLLDKEALHQPEPPLPRGPTLTRYRIKSQKACTNGTASLDGNVHAAKPAVDDLFHDAKAPRKMIFRKKRAT